MNNFTPSDKQKKEYIKRYVDNEILDEETIRDIYKIIRNNEGMIPIKTPKIPNSTGVFVDLNVINFATIDLIYNVIKKRVESIAIK